MSGIGIIISLFISFVVVLLALKIAFSIKERGQINRRKEILAENTEKYISNGPRWYAIAIMVGVLFISLSFIIVTAINAVEKHPAEIALIMNNDEEQLLQYYIIKSGGEIECEISDVKIPTKDLSNYMIRQLAYTTINSVDGDYFINDITTGTKINKQTLKQEVDKLIKGDSNVLYNNADINNAMFGGLRCKIKLNGVQ